MTCQAPHHAVTRRALLGACLVAGALQRLPGCRSTPLPAYQGAHGGGVAIYLIAADWHTEVALPVHVMHEPLRAVTPDFPGAQYLSFGWGERNYYMARAPTVGDAMSALFPGPAVLLVTPLYRPPRESRADAQVFELRLSTAGLDRLLNYLWAAFEKSADGTTRRLAAGPGPGSIFYAATGTYSSSYTCNTWIAEGLRVAGVAVTPSGVVFAGQLTDQLRSLDAWSHALDWPGHRLRAATPDRQVGHLDAGAAGQDGMDGIGRAGDAPVGPRRTCSAAPWPGPNRRGGRSSRPSPAAAGRPARRARSCDGRSTSRCRRASP